MKYMVVAALIVLVTIAVITSRHDAPSHTRSTKSKTAGSSIFATFEPALQTEPTCRSASEILASLPAEVGGLKEFLPEWASLEAALISDPDTVLQSLLARYARETDPAYKGLLAVLLSADPSTHELILADLLDAEGKEKEFIRGFAMYALVKNHSIREVYPGETLRGLLDLINYRRDELDREDNADQRFIAWQQSGFPLGPTSGNLMMGPPRLHEVGATEDSRVRDLLLAWPEGEPYWIEQLVYEARKQVARKDADFAGQILRKFSSTGDPEVIAEGLALIFAAKVHEHDLAAIAELARRPSEGDVLFERALWLIALQRTPTGEAHLRTLLRHFQSDDTRWHVMNVMKLTDARTYVDVGAASVSSENALIRSEAIQILYYGDREGSRTTIVQALMGDPSPLVRKQAASLIRWGVSSWGRASMTAGERDAVTWAKSNDVNLEVREEAQSALEAKRHMTKFKADGTPYSVED